MKPLYEIVTPRGKARAVVNGTNISSINVEPAVRGRRLGSEVLKLVTDDADALGVTLTLSVGPSGHLDAAALTEWYARNGFHAGQMTRAPRPKGGA